jgi:hypothetical protein
MWQIKAGSLLSIRCCGSATPMSRRFPPPWFVDDPETKLGQDCFIGQRARVVYFEDEAGATRLGGSTGQDVGRASTSRHA